MRVLVYACALGAAALPGLQSARAQTWSPSVNQRMDPQTSQADSYVGVSLGQLIMALGLTLKGAAPLGLDDIRLLHPKQTAAAPEPSAAPPAGAVDSTLIPAAQGLGKAP